MTSHNTTLSSIEPLKVELFRELEKQWLKDLITTPIVVTGLIDWDKSDKFNKVFPTYVQQIDGNWAFYLFGLTSKDTHHNKLVHQYETKYPLQRKALKLHLRRRQFEFITDDLDILETLYRWECNHTLN